MERAAEEMRASSIQKPDADVPRRSRGTKRQGTDVEKRSHSSGR